MLGAANIIRRPPVADWRAKRFFPFRKNGPIGTVLKAANMPPQNDYLALHACFKKCHNCGCEWESRDQFLSDADIQLIGYQVNFREIALGLVYFNHACMGTLTIPAYYFVDLYHGPVFEKHQKIADDRPEYCFRKDEIKPCPEQCECAFIKGVLQVIKYWPCGQTSKVPPRKPPKADDRKDCPHASRC
jgi:hypothetical protein